MITVTTTIGSGSTITIQTVLNGSVYVNNGGATSHAALTNRDAADQHPIGAVTGLQTALNNLAFSIPMSTEPYPRAYSTQIDLSRPYQTSQVQLSAGETYTPITGTAIEGFIHRRLVDLNGFSVSFTGMSNWDVNATPDVNAGMINILFFFRVGPIYFYLWGTAYSGVLDDQDPPALDNVDIINILQIIATIQATSTNENATFYWSALPNGSGVPSYAAIIAGTSAVDFGSISLAVGVQNTDSIQNLVYSTAYDVYYFAEDSSGNRSDVTLFEFTTAALSVLSTPAPSGSQFDSDTARFTWSNISGNAGYAYQYRINSGAWSVYIDIAQNGTQQDVDATVGQTVGFRMYAKGNGTTSADSVVCNEVSVLLTANQPPQALNVDIDDSNGTGVGDLLLGVYTYHDDESDVESGTTFRWLRDGSMEVATTQNYTVTLNDQNHTLTFEVTVRSSTGTSPGAPVQSTPLSIPANVAPQFTVAGTFSGTPQEGQVLTGALGTYFDADGDLAGTHTYQWYRQATNTGYTGTPIGGATSLNYTCVAADVGNYLYRADTPVAATGTTPGTPVNTAYSAIVTSAVLTMPRFSGAEIAWYDFTDVDSLSLNTNKIITATDKFGNGNNITQATDGNRPIYNATGGSNNLPYASFTTSQNLTLAALTQAQPITISIVFRFETFTDGLLPMDFGSGTNGVSLKRSATVSHPIIGSFTVDSLTDVAGATWAQQLKGGYYRTGQFVTYNMVRNGNSSKHYINGAAEGNVIIGPGTLGITRIRLGGSLACYIHEVAIHNRVLTTSEINQVNAYFSQKYAYTDIPKVIVYGDLIAGGAGGTSNYGFSTIFAKTAATINAEINYANPSTNMAFSTMLGYNTSDLQYNLNKSNIRVLIQVGFAATINAQWNTDLISVVDDLIAKGYSASNICLVTPPYDSGRVANNTLIQGYMSAIAVSHGVKYADCVTYMEANGGDTLLNASDYPTDAGHDAMCTVIETAYA